MEKDLIEQIKQTATDINHIQQIAFDTGYETALRDFAWWKDGVQYVGCGVKTLKQILEERKAKK
jgi:hypothetical protein